MVKKKKFSPKMSSQSTSYPFYSYPVQKCDAPSVCICENAPLGEVYPAFKGGVTVDYTNPAQLSKPYYQGNGGNMSSIFYPTINTGGPTQAQIAVMRAWRAPM